ncbi:MAG: hypothetical protein R2789_09195 [Microthrixaceae bacterium]
MAQDGEHAHLLVVVALAAAGNPAVNGGFTPNQGGWDCEMEQPIDLDIVRAALVGDDHDVRIDAEGGRIDCLHCWSGVHGPLS